MNQLIEFIGNHTLLIIAFVATLGMLIYTEYTRMITATSALSPYAATRLMNDSDTIVIDVRNESEYKGGHLQGARNVPVAKIDEYLHDLEKHRAKDVVVYCDNGMRTARATGRLKKAGFEKLHTLQGGLTAWEKASLPTVTR